MSFAGRDQLEDCLAQERAHLSARGEPHFHITVSTDNENEWVNPRFLSSPPYRDRELAERDAKDPRLLALVNGFDVDVLDCSRACPRSGFGHFGWDDEQREPHRWWDGMRWR
jgi:hypothetical protein